jgi:hypothetical protein
MARQGEVRMSLGQTPTLEAWGRMFPSSGSTYSAIAAKVAGIGVLAAASGLGLSRGEVHTVSEIKT